MPKVGAMSMLLFFWLLKHERHLPFIGEYRVSRLEIEFKHYIGKPEIRAHEMRSAAERLLARRTCGMTLPSKLPALAYLSFGIYTEQQTCYCTSICLSEVSIIVISPS